MGPIIFHLVEFGCRAGRAEVDDDSRLTVTARSEFPL